ncbi:hypothetical protein ACFSTI_19545 [Rhizorhabdus histidinilytica]|uniref:Uncharacterized protein n=1 Tax=Rhizorhabdus histidinilytica TaxID=439228 RepID=A0A1T5BXH7_9SPHN|nr:hypothetical protein [Rhizorhabdus histidinilytica]SKB51844.1 hypothetical protein SAMN06295920_103360 [Rhizorhabdus histidinilytica]
MTEDRTASSLQSILIDAVDIATANLHRIKAALSTIDELNLGLGGKHFELMCMLCDACKEEIDETLTSLRALHDGSAAA